MCEKITLFLSINADTHKMVETTILQNLKNNYLCGNVFPYSCTVRDKNTGKFNIEKGFKVDIFFDSDKLTYHNYDMAFTTWIRIRTQLGLTCAWVETTEYQGCINQWQKFKDFCKEFSYLCGKCSEYDEPINRQFGGDL